MTLLHNITLNSLSDKYFLSDIDLGKALKSLLWFPYTLSKNIPFFLTGIKLGVLNDKKNIFESILPF